jgi:hypothetical protein
VSRNPKNSDREYSLGAYYAIWLRSQGIDAETVAEMVAERYPEVISQLRMAGFLTRNREAREPKDPSPH